VIKRFKQILKTGGVTLVEVLVATSLFAVATIVAGDILVSNVQLEKKTSIQNTLAAEMRIILQQISSEIQNGTIDYEEYYSVCVLQKACKSNSVFALYGFHNGVYGSRFYDPGKSLDGAITNNPEDLGSECSFPSPQNGKECEVTYNLSVDLNTGQNPFTGDPNDVNAFCDHQDGNRGVCDKISGGSVILDKLFILDKTGTKKTIIAKKLIRANAPIGPADYALAKVVMNGKDYDQNGVMDIFSCAEGYKCLNSPVLLALWSPFKNVLKIDSTFISQNNITVPLVSDLDQPFEGKADQSMFVPITPLFANVKDVQFIIHPLEDPYKAYAESDMKGQPSVTIILKVGLSSEAAKNYPGIFPDITLQTTVAAGVTNRIDSYPPVVELKDANAVNWLKGMTSGWPSRTIYPVN